MNGKSPTVLPEGFTRNSIPGVYVHATAVNNLLRTDALTEFGRSGTGIASFALGLLATAAALALGPVAAGLAFIGIAVVWSAGATIAFWDAMVLPLVEPLSSALAAFGITVGYRLVLADRNIIQQIAQKRAHQQQRKHVHDLVLWPARRPIRYADLLQLRSPASSNRCPPGLV